MILVVKSMMVIYVKYFQNRNYNNLLIYNVLLGFIYFFYKYLLIFMFSANIEVWTVSFTNFIGHINMFATGNIVGEQSLNSLPIYIDQIILKLKGVFSKYFLTFSFQSILIYLNILLSIFFFKKISKKEIITILFLISGFIAFQTICNFRYEDPSYFIFSEFLLILALSILIKNFTLNKKYFLFLFTIFVLLVFSNLNTINEISERNKNNGCDLILSEIKDEKNFFSFFAGRIPKSTISKFCLVY